MIREGSGDAKAQVLLRTCKETLNGRVVIWNKPRFETELTDRIHMYANYDQSVFFMSLYEAGGKLGGGLTAPHLYR